MGGIDSLYPGSRLPSPGRVCSHGAVNEPTHRGPPVKELKNLNLNLLVHLDALLAQRSVSGAAQQLGLSQPTVSSALARLRRHFDDELLARQGSRYVLTPLAAALHPLVTDAITSSERVFLGRAGFDPVRTRRQFVILTSDFWLEAVGPSISRLLSDAAPASSVRFDLLRIADLDDPVESLRTLDGILLPHGAMPEAPHVDLLTTEWRALVDARNDRVGSVLDRDTLAALPWVLYADRSTATTALVTSTIMRQLVLAGLDPRVEVTVGTFSAVPSFVRGTDRVAVVHKSLALRAELNLGLRSLALPMAFDALTLAFWWHPRHTHDHAHRWFRSLTRSAAALVAADASGFELAPATEDSPGAAR